MKVLYCTGVVTAHRAYDKGCGLYGFFNGLLWILLGLNIYWLVVRVKGWLPTDRIDRSLSFSSFFSFSFACVRAL